MFESAHDVDLAGIVLRPRERIIAGPAADVAVEPLVMRVVIALVRRAGRAVDRVELFRLCWGEAPVGDDSLNRVIAAARKALRSAGDDRVLIETVPAQGYVLRLSRALAGGRALPEAGQACRAAHDSWRAAYPEPDYLSIERLRRATALCPDHGRAWGMLALMHRHAAEYSGEGDRPDHLRQCEVAAHQALEIDPEQAEARVALVSVAPLFGHWREAHDRLSAICAEHPTNVVAAHDLAIVEMATGRVSAAKAIIDRLLGDDRLAAAYGYKSTYHHWSVGDLDTMDRRADSALQLWPAHPAIWTARFWTLAYTGRLTAAAGMLAEGAVRPPMPPALSPFLRSLLEAIDLASAAALETCAQRAAEAARLGPTQAINSLFTLGLIGDAARARSLANSYYLHEGPTPVPNNTASEAPLNEARRRLTQILFTPAGELVRSGPSFEALCDRTGLTAYWSQSGRTPDFLSRR